LAPSNRTLKDKGSISVPQSDNPANNRFKNFSTHAVCQVLLSEWNGR